MHIPSNNAASKFSEDTRGSYSICWHYLTAKETVVKLTIYIYGFIINVFGESQWLGCKHARLQHFTEHVRTPVQLSS